MKDIFKTRKRSIAAILTLCILLGIAGMGVYADSVIPEENTTETEETIQELMPMGAARCATSWFNDDGSRNYPPNYGFAGSFTTVTLPAGTQLGHYGDPSSFYCDLGASASGLALPLWNSGVYSVYTLTKNTRFLYGIVADWGGSTGGGYQYYQID